MENRLKVALTHDIDRTKKTYQYITHFLRALKNTDICIALYQMTSFSERDKVYCNFEEIMSIEKRSGVKSTFFFLIESIPINLYKFNK